jgi:prepilin-type N-terminal cleavage/methylation domain-containing protein
VGASGVHHSSFIIHHWRRAFTLVEMLVVVGIIAIILTIAITSLRALTGGVQEGSARTVLKTLLASARAEAAAKGHVVGVYFTQYRFPPDYPLAPGASRQAEDGTTFGMIVYPARCYPNWNESPPTGYSLRDRFIKTQPAGALQDAAARMADSDWLYVPVDGRDPTRFPQGVELAIGIDSNVADPLNDAAMMGTNVINNTTFAVLFSPTGQVTIRRVAVIQRSNRDSVVYGPDYTWPPSGDAAFLTNIDGARPTDVVPLLLRDQRQYSPNTLPPDPPKMSQNSLWLYDQTARKQTARPWTDYLKGRGKSPHILINPYTGQLEEPSG